MNKFFGSLIPAALVAGALIAPTHSRAQGVTQSQSNFGRLPITFEKNEGQFDSRIKFVSRGATHAVLLTAQETFLSLTKRELQPERRGRGGRDSREKVEKVTTSIVRMRLSGSLANANLRGLRQLAGSANYLTGNNPSKWRRNVPLYEAVAVEQAGPGVDLQFYGNARRVELDVIAAAGVQTDSLAMEYEGADSIVEDASGCININTAAGQIRALQPIAYQMIRGKRSNVSCRYRKTGARRVGFTLGRYDKKASICIDPVLEFSTLVGGSGSEGQESRFGVAVDADNSTYITGYTSSADYPTTTGLQTSLRGTTDAVVTKINAAGSALVYSTYLGGTGSEKATSIALDSSKNAYLTGETNSSDFPLVNPFQSNFPGAFTIGFVSKLNAAGTALVYSTHLGSGGPILGRGITVDSTGSAVVVGRIGFGSFPLVNAFQSSEGGGGDAFITKFSPAGTSLVFSTLLGGNDVDEAASVALDSAGNIYLAGRTASNNLQTVNAYQAAFGGSTDGFVAKLTSAGARLFVSYLGGSAIDDCTGVAVDAQDRAVVVGSAQSPTFPLKNPIDSSLASSEAFVLKFNSAGSDLEFSTFLGGGATDFGFGVDIDSTGRIYVVGVTSSPNFPVQAPLQATIGGSGDAFIACLQPAGTSLFYSTFLGGTGFDSGLSIALDGSDNAYIGGSTQSSNFPTSNPLDQSLGGSIDFWVAKINPNTPPPTLTLTNVQPTTGIVGTVVDFTVTSNQTLVPGSTLTVGGLSASLISQSGLTYTFRRPLSGDEGQPTPPIVITGTNQASITTTVTTTGLTTDFTRPSFSNIAASPALARIGTPVSITFVASETVAANPTVTVGNQTANFSSKSGLSYTYTLNVEAAAGSGLPTITVSGSDAAGNPGSSTAQPLTTDFTLPSFTNISTNPSLARVGTAVSITFTASESLIANPTVAIGGQAANHVSKSGLNYTYSAPIDPSAGEGSPLVTVSGTDLAGNPGSSTANPLTTDFTGPAFSSISASPALAKIGTLVAITFAASEPVTGNPVVLVGSQAAGFISKSGLSYTYSVTVSTAANEGSPNVSVSGTDQAGNPGNSTANPLVTDFTGPTFTSFASTPSLAKATTPVTITFSASEALASNPTVTIGGQGAAFATKQGLVYSYTRTINGTEGQPQPVVLVNGTDVAGNPGQSTGTPLTTDFSPPAVSNLLADPTLAISGTAVSLTFDASETLGSNPSVTVGGQAAEFVSLDAMRYTYRRTIDRSEGEGQPAVRITGSDPAGNPLDFTASPLATDFTPPSFTSISASPGLAREGTGVTFSFTASEALLQNPTVHVGAQEAAFQSKYGLDFTYSVTISSQAGEGSPQVTVAGRDIGGNLGTSTAQPLVTDFTAPNLSNLSVSPSIAKVGTTVTVTFTTSEPLGQTPVVSVGGKGAALAEQSGNTYVFTRPLNGTESEGTTSISISVADAAGNTASNQSLSLKIDFTKPSIANLSATPSILKDEDNLSITFAVSESLTTTPTVFVGATNAPLTSRSGVNYSYQHKVTAAQGEGQKPIAVHLVDDAGNTNDLAPGSVTFDFTAPTFSNAVATPAAVSRGTTVAIDFSTSEELAANPTVSIGGKQASFVSVSGSNYRFSRPIDGTEGEGNPEVSISGSDPAGNPGTGSFTPLRTDFTQPTVANLSVAPSPASTGTTVAVSFAASEALGSLPTVSIGGQAAQLSAQNAQTYSFGRRIDGSETEGSAVVSIGLADLVGNTNTITTTTVLDFHAPVATYVSIQPSVARLGTTVTITIDVNQQLAAMPTLTIGGQATLPGTQDGLRYTFVETIKVSNGEGRPVISFTARNLAGNTSVTNSTGLVTDFTSPTATVAALPAAVRSQVTLTVTVDASEDLIASPSVSLGNLTLDLSAQLGRHYVFARTLDGSEPEGPTTLHVRGRDLAGNELIDDTKSVLVDFAAPLPLDIAVSPRAGKRGTDILLSFGVTQAITGTPLVSMTNQPFEFLGLDSATYRFRRTLNGEEGDGLHVPTIRLEDAAGNSSVTTTPAVLTDFTTPTASAFAISPSVGTTGTTVEIRFVASEPLAGSPSVLFGGQPATLVTSQPPFFEFSRTLSGQEPEGLVEARATLTDTVGNVGVSVRTTFVADYTAPRFTNITVSPGPFSIGSTVIVSVTANETLATTPTLGLDLYESLGQVGDSYLFVRQINGTENEGTVQILASGQDRAGNVGQDSSAAFVTDFTKPQASNIHAGPSPATIGTTTAIDFTVSEPLTFAPSVLVGGQSASLLTSSGQFYSYEYTLHGDEQQGNLPIEITMTDPAGNVDTDTSAKMIIDFTAPRPLISAFPIPGKEGAAVTFSALGSSDVSGITSVSWSFAGERISTSPVTTHAFRDGPTTAAVDLTVTDGVGLSATTRLLLPVLNVSPTVVVNAISSPTSGLTTITWRTTEPGLIDTPKVTIEAQDLITQMRSQLVSDVADMQRFTWDTRASKESSFQLFVTVRDKDGGEGTGSSNLVVVNNKPLSIATGGAQPRFFNPAFVEGTSLTYTLSEHATVSVRLIRPSDQSVIATLLTTFQREGSKAAAWDGKDPVTGQIIADGQYGYIVEGIDLLQNRVAKSSLDAGYVVVLDTTAPSAPTIDAFAPLTRFRDFTLTGTKDVGSGIRVLNQSGTTIVDSIPDDSGTWSTRVLLGEGLNHFAILAKDRANNISGSVPFQITLDSIAPDAPVFTSAIPNPTLLNSLSIAGTKEAGSSLIVNGAVRTATAGTDWAESFNLRAGTNSFDFEAQDAAGNKSATSSASTVRTPNSVPAPVFGSALVARTTTVNVTGTKAADTNISIQSVDTGAVVSMPVDASTSWFASLTLSREEQNTFIAQSEDSIGSLSPPTQFVILRDTQAPFITLAAGLTGSVTTSANLTIGIVFQDQPKPPDPGGPHTLSGVNVASVRLLLDGFDVTSQCTVTASSATLPSRNVSPGAHQVTGTVSDLAGNVASVSGSFFVVAPDDGKPPVVTVKQLVNAQFCPAFNPYEIRHEDQAGVEFQTNVPVTGTLTVKSPNSTIVRTISIPQSLPTTVNSVGWDGRDDQGVLVKSGDYTMQIRATNLFNRTTTVSPTAVQVVY